MDHLESYSVCAAPAAHVLTGFDGCFSLSARRGQMCGVWNIRSRSPFRLPTIQDLQKSLAICVVGVCGTGTCGTSLLKGPFMWCRMSLGGHHCIQKLVCHWPSERRLGRFLENSSHDVLIWLGTVPDKLWEWVSSSGLGLPRFLAFVGSWRT